MHLITCSFDNITYSTKYLFDNTISNDYDVALGKCCWNVLIIKTKKKKTDILEQSTFWIIISILRILEIYPKYIAKEEKEVYMSSHSLYPPLPLYSERIFKLFKSKFEFFKLERVPRHTLLCKSTGEYCYYLTFKSILSTSFYLYT